MPHLTEESAHSESEKAPEKAGKLLKCMRVHAPPCFQTDKGDTGDKIAGVRRVTRVTRVRRVTRMTRVTMAIAKATTVTMAIAMRPSCVSILACRGADGTHSVPECA